MTPFSPARVRALLVKELAELRRNRMAMLPVVLLSVFTVALPLLIAVAMPALTGSSLASDPEFLRLAQRGGIPLEVPTLSGEGAVQAFVFQQFLMLQLLIPVTGAMAFAGYSLVGEKQGRTLEPLLATPITTAELLAAKGLGALLPSLGLMVATTTVYAVSIGAFGQPGVLGVVVNVRSALLVLGLGPLAALVALQIAVLVSSRVNDPRTAQQFGALLILPLTGIFVMQFNGLVPLTTPVLLVLLAVLTVIWLVLVALGVALFERETILTRWK
jgi:ABC-2 type transport system permease protein